MGQQELNHDGGEENENDLSNLKDTEEELQNKYALRYDGLQMEESERVADNQNKEEHREHQMHNNQMGIENNTADNNNFGIVYDRP